MTPPAKTPVDELDMLMRDGAAKAQGIIQWAHTVQQQAQQVVDLANAGIVVMQFPQSANTDLQSAITAWRRTNDRADLLLSGMTTLSVGAYTSAVSGLNFTMTPFAVSQSQPALPSPEQQAAAVSARTNLSHVIDRSVSKEDVRALMQQFGLASTQHGEKSATELFDIAWAAYDRPVTQDAPVNTSLIPMREAIESTLQELLRRRPNQEPAKSQQSKVLSIGNQLARNSISAGDVQAWASGWSQLVDELSGSKRGNYSRDEWLAMLRRATLFLQELLQGLDAAKPRC